MKVPSFLRTNQRPKLQSPKRSLLLALLLVLSWSLVLGWGIGGAIAPPVNLLAQNTPLTPGSDRYQLAQEVYLENCSSCHIPIPPEVLPTETWQEILEKPEKHYGQKLPNIFSVSVILLWEYLKTFSRPLIPGEIQPVFVEQSRYFKALHPRVDLPKPANSQSCILCHPGAPKLDYRRLSPEWENQ